MSILITGVAGFIGFHLSKKLLDEGFVVVGVDNLNDYYDVSLKQDRLKQIADFPNFTFYKQDIAQEEGLKEIFEKEHIEIVINLAAQAGVRYSLINPQTYVQSNLVGFANILEMCRTYKVKHLLFASSSSIYGANKKVPFSESDKTDKPVSLYAATKKANELLAYSYSHLYKIPMTGLRFFTVYGPFGRPDMAYFSFTKAILEDKPIKVFNHGDMYRDFTYIDDIVKGIISLIDGSKALKNEPPFKVYNIGNNNPEKLEYFISCIENTLSKQAKKEYLPMQAGDVQRTYADIDELYHDVGFAPKTPLSEGITSFVTWYREYYNQR